MRKRVRSSYLNIARSILREPPVFVYAGFEAMLSTDKTHLPILVCALTSLSDTFSCFYGSECTAHFLVFLTELTVDAYGEDARLFASFII